MAETKYDNKEDIPYLSNEDGSDIVFEQCSNCKLWFHATNSMSGPRMSYHLYILKGTCTILDEWQRPIYYICEDCADKCRCDDYDCEKCVIYRNKWLQKENTYWADGNDGRIKNIDFDGYLMEKCDFCSNCQFHLTEEDEKLVCDRCYNMNYDTAEKLMAINEILTGERTREFRPINEFVKKYDIKLNNTEDDKILN